jgi:Predicted Na+-dependent transporter
MSGIFRFLKDWMLVIGMMTGVSLYCIYHSIPSIHPAGPALMKVVSILQPSFLFLMLFLSFCRVSPKDLRPHRWQFWLLLLQGLAYSMLTLLVVWAGSHHGWFADGMTRLRIPLEAAMICLICPTATACSVVVGKLGGDMAQAITYTVFINVLVALLVPAMVPLLYPSGNISFMQAFAKILSKVFPMLIMPCVAAWLVRLLMPKFHRWLESKTELAFYIWAVSLTLAILMSTRAIYHNEGSAWTLLGIAVSSLICCAFQFWAGRRVGASYGKRISMTVGQALGQKNTVFAIWMGYTFMDPIVSVAGGFYSIWHNLYNSLQLYRHKQEEAATS